MGTKSSKHERHCFSLKFGKHSKQENDIYVALFGYISRFDQDVSFEEGDEMKLVKCGLNETDWLEVIHLKTKAIGFVPASYVAAKGTIQTENWFFKSFSEQEAENLILSEKNEIGAFLIHPTAKNTQAFTLTVKQFKDTIGFYFKHYRIEETNRGKYFIIPGESFKSIKNLVKKYQSGKYHIKLSHPCERSAPQVIGTPPKQTDDWEIEKTKIILDKKIAEGNFADIWKGTWNGVTVAVKIPRKGTMSKQAIFKEINILKQVRHMNLITFYGVCSIDEPIYIIREYMDNGNLNNYLKVMGPEKLKLEELVDISAEITNGMAFLEMKHILHRNLKASNILVGENQRIKIGGLGLAQILLKDRDSFVSHVYISTFPIKWTAPEALQHSEFSSKSDVWSFGVVLMEIFTYGGEPYPNLSAEQLIVELCHLYRMKMPTDHVIPEEIFTLMQKCWSQDPEQRPSFEYLKNYFENFSLR